MEIMVKQIVPNLYLLEGLRASNAYLLVSPEGLTLVDSGMAGESGKITGQIIQGGFEFANLKQIVLTHGHGDHVGSAAELARQTAAKVLAHPDEVALIEHTEAAPTSLAGRFMTWAEGHFFKQPHCKVDILLANGEPIPNSSGFFAVHTPGHTLGSLCLYHPERKILICGDALFNRHPLTGKRGLQEPPAMVTKDSTRAHAAIVSLSKLNVDILLCGHGEPILEAAGEEIKKLVEPDKAHG
jgi:glyoxylase-like metal-dependent hydrolase (beta-lactamase superfamily II)